MKSLGGVLIPEATTKGYAIANEGDSVNLQYPESETRRGRVGKQVSQTLLCNDKQGVVVSNKKKLCDAMLKNGHLKEMDMIRHSYTNDRQEDLERVENENNISAAITTRADTLGVVVSGVTLGQSEAFQREPLENLSRTLKCDDKNGVEIKEERNLSIRKLTPRECGRLMGVSDEDISKMESVNSNAQLYKQFGNSIVVDVLVNIFKQLF